MKIWQSDLFRNLSSPEIQDRWLLIICDREGNLIYQAECEQSKLNATWLTNQLKEAIQDSPPDKIQIFRPQITGLFSLATESLNVSLETTRRTPAIKQKIRQYTENNLSVKSGTNYLSLDRPPPQNLPENIWGNNWNFVSIASGEIINFVQNRPIPFCDLPDTLLSINSQLNPTIKIPGIVINGGKKSLAIARWLVQEQPVALNYIPTEIGKSGGLVLESGLVDRWILATFDSLAVAQAAKAYQQAKEQAQQLHFLLVQPDDSGMTYTGFWLLKEE